MRSNDDMLDEIENANQGEGPDPIATYTGEALRDLAAAIDARNAADSAIVAAVLQARDEGASWQAIGDILGLTRQGARKHYNPAA